MSISLAPARGCTFPNAHWWDQVKSHEEMLRASWKSLHHLQTSWRDHCDKKKSPLSPSILNSCHINNLLHWDVQTPQEQFPTMSHEASRKKYNVHLSQCSWPWNLFAKLMFLEKHFSRYTQFKLKLSHTQLWAPLWGLNRGCGIASGWQKASQLTVPAPTGPTTANSSPGLTVKERPWRVGGLWFLQIKVYKNVPISIK